MRNPDRGGSAGRHTLPCGSSLLGRVGKISESIRRFQKVGLGWIAVNGKLANGIGAGRLEGSNWLNGSVDVADSRRPGGLGSKKLEGLREERFMTPVESEVMIACSL